MSDIVENNPKINWKLTTEAPRNSFMMDDEIRNFIEPEYDYIGQVQNIPNSISENSNHMDFFSLLLPNSFIDHIVIETNRYATQTIHEMKASNTIKPSSRINYWKDVNNTEIKLYLGIIFWMGLISNSEIRGIFFILFKIIG